MLMTESLRQSMGPVSLYSQGYYGYNHIVGNAGICDMYVVTLPDCVPQMH